jgi:hypothetical protein
MCSARTTPRSVAVSFIAASFFLPIVGKAQQLPTVQASIPDRIMYRMLFRHVARYQALADQTEATGHSSPLRHAFRRKLDLTPTEELKSRLADNMRCNARVAHRGGISERIRYA